MQHVLLGADDVVAPLQHVHGALQPVLELFVQQFVAGFLTLDACLGCDVVLLSAVGIEPVLFDGAGEGVLPVLQVELRGELLQLGRLDVRSVAPSVEDGDAQVQSCAHVQIGLHLFSPCFAAAAGLCAAQTCACADGGQVAALGNVQLHVGSLDAKLGALYLGACLQGFRISLLCAGHDGQHLFVGRQVAGHVEGCVQVEFEECLQLPLVVGKLCLAVDHGILCAAELCLELHHVGVRHLALLHHLHAAVVLALCRAEQLFVDLLGLLRVHYLYVELSYLLLDGELALLCGEGRDAVLQLLCLDVLVIDAAVPQGDVGIQSIVTLVGDVAACARHLVALHHVEDLGEGAVAHAVARVEAQAGEECAFVLPERHLAALLADAVLLHLDVVLLCIVDAVLQRPRLLGEGCAGTEQ